MGVHLIDGDFQSDKYKGCPAGKVPLSTKDPAAQDLLWVYAHRRRVGSHGSTETDPEFSDDLEEALRLKGYVAPSPAAALANVSELAAMDGAARVLFNALPGESLASAVLRTRATLTEDREHLEKAVAAAEEHARSTPVAHAIGVAEAALHALADKNLFARLALDVVQPVAVSFNPELLNNRCEVLDVIMSRDGKGITIKGRQPHWFAKQVLESFRESLSTAENYVELRFEDDEKGESFAVTIQRVGKVTPHGGRVAAEARATAAESRVLELSAEVDRLRALFFSATGIHAEGGGGVVREKEDPRGAIPRRVCGKTYEYDSHHLNADGSPRTATTTCEREPNHDGGCAGEIRC